MLIGRLPDGSIFLCNQQMAKKIITEYRLIECQLASNAIQPGTLYPDVDKCKRDVSRPYRKVVGSLLLIACTCRPNLSHSEGTIITLLRACNKQEKISSVYELSMH